MASPRFSLPSLTITIRLAASSGNDAWASFIAAGQVRVLGIERGSRSARGTCTSSSNGGISMAASRPKTITPARSSSLAVFADRLVDVLDHRLASRAGDAQRLVQQIDHRQPVAGPHHLHLGQREDQQDEHERSGRRSPRAAAIAPARPAADSSTTRAPAAAPEAAGTKAIRR